MGYPRRQTFRPTAHCSEESSARDHVKESSPVAARVGIGEMRFGSRQGRGGFRLGQEGDLLSLSEPVLISFSSLSGSGLPEDYGGNEGGLILFKALRAFARPNGLAVGYG